ncbi:MAG TPA: cytochrome P450 [Acidimicrobiia bacterium]|nr:cytochrome P450 [Acidimicrobiia bacterium]
MTQRFPIGDSITIEQLSTDPHLHLARLRAAEPVSWIPALAGWLVTGREAAIEVMRDADTYTVDDPRFSTARVIGPSMLSLDGETHRRHREPFGDPFRAGAVRGAMSDWVHRRAGELVDELAPAGSGDLRADVAAPLAIDVMMRMLDLPGVAAADLLGWYDGIVGAVHAVTEGEALPASGPEAYAALHTAVSARLDESALLAVVGSNGDLTVDEIVANVAVLLFGGVVTSESATAIAFQFILADPEVAGAVTADRSLVPAAVEETLRLEPSAAVVDRYATRDAELRGVHVTSGDLVRVSLSGANRDPATFSDPDRLDLSRANGAQHVTFARGPHACLGIHVARLEAVAAVGAVLDRLPDVSIEKVEPIRGLVFRAPEHVPVRWASNGL